MDLTQEQLDTIIAAVIEKTKNTFNELLKNVITKDSLAEVMKQFVTSEQLNEFKTSVSQDIAKANEAITKVASETETKIKELRTTPAAVKSWWNRDII